MEKRKSGKVEKWKCGKVEKWKTLRFHFSTFPNGFEGYETESCRWGFSRCGLFGKVEKWKSERGKLKSGKKKSENINVEN